MTQTMKNNVKCILTLVALLLVGVVGVKADGKKIDAGYYSIKNGGGQYINVVGRKTVNFVSDIDAAPGTVIKVESNADGQVLTLRSQGVDIPGYADRAMVYVPKIVQLVCDKLGATGEGNLLGENGLDAILKKFNESFDYHLYVEPVGSSYRIYGQTPSMQPVVDFYAENKANVDAKLPGLEAFINDAIKKLLEKTGGSGASILVPFRLLDVWTNMNYSEEVMPKPVDDASKLEFLQTVLMNKQYVWDFAYHTAMIYWSKLKDHPKFQDALSQLGDYAKYIDKIDNIRPETKYYLVQNEGKLDIFNEANVAITGEASNTLWTLEPREAFTVNFDEAFKLNDKFYTTLYTDFAYTLPEGVKAYKVTKVSDAGVAVKEELKSVPAQTPVLLEAESIEEPVKLTLDMTDGTAPADNLLVGADYLINEYQLKTPQLEGLFNMAKEIFGEDFYNTYVKEYEHLMAKNAGTVNNKYFFGLNQADMKGMENVRILNLNDSGEKLGFYGNYVSLGANQAIIIDSNDPVKLFIEGDVNRDGDVNIKDVMAIVEIITGKVTKENNPDDYDFIAANFDKDTNGNVTISDVAALLNYLIN